MSDELDRLSNDKQNSKLKLDLYKTKFINKLQKNRVEIKTTGGKLKIKTTPWLFRTIKNGWIKFKRSFKYHWNKLVTKVFKPK